MSTTDTKLHYNVGTVRVEDGSIRVLVFRTEVDSEGLGRHLKPLAFTREAFDAYRVEHPDVRPWS